MTPVKGWDILGSKWTLRSWCVFVGGKKNGQSKDLSHCNNGQIVMAGGLGQSISKTATSRSPECSGMQWLVSSRRGPRKSWAPTAHCGERRLARLVWSHRSATVARIAEKVNTGYDRKVSEHTHTQFIIAMLCSHRPFRVPILTPIHCRKHLQWTCEHQNWIMEQ